MSASNNFSSRSYILKSGVTVHGCDLRLGKVRKQQTRNPRSSFVSEYFCSPQPVWPNLSIYHLSIPSKFLHPYSPAPTCTEQKPLLQLSAALSTSSTIHFTQPIKVDYFSLSPIFFLSLANQCF